jgi:hypothetical protein
MQYLIHSPSDARELENLDISFEVLGPYDDARMWPMVIQIDDESASAEALNYGIVSHYPKN